MITKGNKIKLIKPMGVFDNIGEICEVTNVTEDGGISFRFGGCHLGCMSYSEYEKYFEPYEPSPKKREWTGWTKIVISYCDLFDVGKMRNAEVRNNGKTTQIRTKLNSDDKTYIKAESNCSPTDEFDFLTGVELAKYRLKIKLLQIELNDFLDKM